MSSTLCFNLDQSKILSSGYGLNMHMQESDDRTLTVMMHCAYKAVSFRQSSNYQLFTKRQNLRLVQIQSTCRRQNKCDLN